jgi:hypothetical protein
VSYFSGRNPWTVLAWRGGLYLDPTGKQLARERLYGHVAVTF